MKADLMANTSGSSQQPDGGSHPMTQGKAHPTPAVTVPSEPMFWVRLCGDGLYEGPHHHNSSEGRMLRDEKPAEWHPLYLATPPSLPAAQAVEGVEAVLKDIRWRLDDIRDMLMKENGRGDRIYGCDEWSTPVVNLQTAIRVVDRALAGGAAK